MSLVKRDGLWNEEHRYNQYDATGKLQDTRAVTRRDDSKAKTHVDDIRYHDTGSATGLGYDNAGNLRGYQQMSDGSATTTRYEYRTHNGNYLQSTATTVHDGRTAISHTWHDANGFISNIAETNPDGTSTFKDLRFDRAFVNDAKGNALYVNQAAGRTGRIQNGPGGYLGGSVGDSMDPGHIQRQVVANGEVLGRYGDAYDRVNSSPQGEVLKYVHSTDFQMEAQVLNLKGASVDPVSYTVVGGETLRDVARNVLGDASLWWRIADANALAVSADAPLTAGQTLSVPKLALNANNADTFQPYDPSKITGSMDPTLPMPAQKERCGGFGQVIMAVVAVAVAIWAPQFLTQMGATGLFGSGGTLTALGGAVGGAAGSIASQVVGNAIGVQDGFSWKGVALGALAGGISAGLAGTELLGGTGWQITAVRMATANALTQGVAVATGLQKSFDWKGVAASAVGAGVGAAVGEALSGYSLPEGMAGPQTPAAFSGLGDFGGALARGTISGFAAGTAAAIARGGKVAIQQVAADAFGNALGSSFADQMQRPGQQAASTPQGIGPWSDANYRNGMDVESDRVTNLNGFMNAFSNQGGNNGYPGVQLAYNGNGAELGGVNFSGDRLPSMYTAPQVVRSGSTVDGRPFEEWDTGATTVGVPPQPAIVGVPLEPLSASGTGLRNGSIKADQGYWASLSGIAGSHLSFTDKVGMAWGTTKYYFRNSDEAQGSVQMLSGGLEITGGVALGTGGGPLGVALGAVSIAHGVDNMATGFSRVMGYGSNPTVTYQLVEAATGSPTLASAVDQGIPFLTGVASAGQGLRIAEERVLNNTAYRGLTPQDAAALDEGMGLTAKNPNGVWTVEDHVRNGNIKTRGGALRNDPWIGTTRDYEVVIGPQGYNSGNGIVAINLNKVPNAQVELWQTAPRTNIVDPYDLRSTLPYHRSVWAQEVSIYQSVPSQAIYTPFSPLSQVQVYRPITYGLTLGSTGFTSNHGGSQ